MRGSASSHPYQHLRLSFSFSHPKGYIAGSYCEFNVYFPVTNDVENLFMCLLAICVSSLRKGLLKNLLSLFTGLSSIKKTKTSSWNINVLTDKCIVITFS